VRKYERVALLKETTMKIVARRTMVGLSMRMVSDESGVNQSMIYRDFKTKDNLLRVCYKEVYEDFFGFFKEKMHNTDHKELSEVITESFWDEYIDILIQYDFRTLYYCEYREWYKSRLHMNGMDAGIDNYSLGWIMSERVREKDAGYDPDGQYPKAYHVDKKECYAIDHLIETATTYAKRVLRKEMEDTEENRAILWDLLCRGLDELQISE
jgi:AcrR family transcriptional regulator